MGVYTWRLVLCVIDNRGKCCLRFIENVASKLHVDAQKLYAALTGQTDILQEYIIPEYEVLHTQDKDYIVDDIIDTMKERNAKLGMQI